MVSYLLLFHFILDCPVLSLPANAIFSTTTNHENVTVTVSCDPYFTRFGHEFITCRPGGFWDNSLPTCRRGKVLYIIIRIQVDS